jgi:hypothetical protein
MTEHIRRQSPRRSAAEPIIGHLKDDHRMDRDHLANSLGDTNKAVFPAVGYNFRRLLVWLRLLLPVVPIHLGPIGPALLSSQSRLIGLVHGRLASKVQGRSAAWRCSPLLAPSHEGVTQNALSRGSFFHVQDRPCAIAIDEWDLDPGSFLEHGEIAAQFEVGG